MNRSLLIAILLIFFADYSLGQDVELRVKFDTNRILIGDQVGFTVSVDQPASLKIKIPQFRDTLYGKIEIVSGPLTDTSRTGERMNITSRYLVTSFDSGKFQLPPQYAEYTDGSTIKRVYSDYTFLEVSRVNITPPDTTLKIFDIVQPYKAPLTLAELLPWILLFLLSAALILFAIRYFRKYWRVRSDSEKEPEQSEPAHVIAFRELSLLRDQELWQNGMVKEYYTRLTEILRKYLEKRYRVYSLEMTTSETLAELLKKGFRKNESYNTLREVLTAADLVKFAKYNPDPVEIDSDFQKAWGFVEATMEQVLDSVVKESSEGGDR